jgi:hypothetical protein
VDPASKELGKAEASPGSKESAIVFTKPSQIVEIMREVNRLQLPLLMRYSNTGKAVRGMFSKYDSDKALFVVTGVSAQGDKLMQVARAVKVEFILLSKKIVFISNVLRKRPGELILQAPQKIVAIERRLNVRYKVSLEQAAFVEFPEILVSGFGLDAPFTMPQGTESRKKKAKAKLRVDDVSLGGLACFTRAAAIAKELKTQDDSVPAIVSFPNQGLIHVPVSIRWTKKTTVTDREKHYEQVSNTLHEMLDVSFGRHQNIIRESFHRVGLQFAEVSSDLDGALRTFIRGVQEAESV